MNTIRANFHIEQKNFHEDEKFFTFKGHAAVFGNVDFANDRIHKGAFTNALLRIAISSKRLPIKWQHDPDAPPIGVFVDMREDEKGLFVEGKMPKDDTFVRGRVIPQMKIGSIKQMSIGYITKEFHNDKEGVRNITEADLMEASLVTMAMNEEAMITEMKGVVSFQNFKIADRKTEWDRDKAKKRVREWAGAENGLDSKEIQNKYKLCFIWYDKKNPDSFDSYKLPIADIIDGELTVIPKAVFSAAAAVNGARGGVDIPESDIPQVKSHIDKYYRKMNLDSPFQNKKSFRIDDFSTLTVREFENCLKNGIKLSNEGSKQLISCLNKKGLFREVNNSSHQDDVIEWKRVLDVLEKIPLIER